jgi:hypothetical protein
MTARIKKYGWLIAVAIVLAALATAWILMQSHKKGDAQTDGSLRYYNQMGGFGVETEDGFYYMINGFLYFYDFNAKEDVVVCNKPNCKHEEWISSTPDEQRCNAYTSSWGSGFVCDDQLYILAMSEDSSSVLELTRSNLDRSGQEVIAEIASDFSTIFAVKDHAMYLTNTVILLEENDEGIPVSTGESDTGLLSIDLQSGNVREVGERKTGYSGELRMLGTVGDKIYLAYYYSEEYIDSTYIAEDRSVFHSQLYAFDVNTGIYEPVDFDLDEDMLPYSVADNKLFTQKSAEGSSFDMHAWNLETGESKFVATAQNIHGYFDGQLIYQADDLYYCYDVNKGDTTQINETVVSEFYVRHDADEYFYGARIIPDSNSVNALILKEDYYNGNPNYIDLEPKYAV